MITHSTVPSNLKHVDITPAHKRLTKRLNPTIGQLVSYLFQIYSYMVEKLPIYQGGFTTKFSDQCCLIRMIERWSFSIDEKGYTGALFTDLTKAIDFSSLDDHSSSKDNVKTPIISTYSCLGCHLIWLYIMVVIYIYI